MAIEDDIDDMAATFGKIKELMEVVFSLGTPENAGTSPPRRAAVNTWTNYYWHIINKLGQVLQKLYPLISQCKAIDSNTLMLSKLHLVRQLHSLKGKYDKEYEGLLNHLGSLTHNILLRAFEENPKKSDRDKVSSYFMELQVEVTKKIDKSSVLNSEINS